jgi:hypothetical protein
MINGHRASLMRIRVCTNSSIELWENPLRFRARAQLFYNGVNPVSHPPRGNSSLRDSYFGHFGSATLPGLIGILETFRFARTQLLTASRINNMLLVREVIPVGL